MLRHTCLGCGASCEAQLVGPLDDETATRMRTLHAKLAPQHPRLAANPPLVVGRTPAGDALSFLHFPDKRCVFLDERQRCLLHAHFGAEAKPEACRRFPALAIDDGDGLRAGVRPLCYHMHQELSGAEILDLDLVTAVAAKRPPVRVEPGAPAEAIDEALFHEAQILAWCDEPGMTLAELLARLAGHPVQVPSRRTVSLQAATALADAAARLPQALAEWAAELEKTVHGGHVARLLSTMGDLQAAQLCTEPPPRWQALAIRSLRAMVWLRETSRFPSVVVGALALAAGAQLAAALARADDEHTPSEVEASTVDRFARALVAWNRMLIQSQAFMALFPGPEAVGKLVEALD